MIAELLMQRFFQEGIVTTDASWTGRRDAAYAGTWPRWTTSTTWKPNDGWKDSANGRPAERPESVSPDRAGSRSSPDTRRAALQSSEPAGIFWTALQLQAILTDETL